MGSTVRCSTPPKGSATLAAAIKSGSARSPITHILWDRGRSFRCQGADQQKQQDDFGHLLARPHVSHETELVPGRVARDPGSKGRKEERDGTKDEAPMEAGGTVPISANQSFVHLPCFRRFPHLLHPSHLLLLLLHSLHVGYFHVCKLTPTDDYKKSKTHVRTIETTLTTDDLTLVSRP